MTRYTETLKNNTKRVGKRADETLLCPKCQTPLEVRYTRDVDTGHCKQCRGLWVDHAKEKQLLNVTPQVFSIDELKRLPKFYQPMSRRAPSGYVPCPVCRQLMHRKNWGTHSGVMVDKCVMHGTWYDEGKLDKIKEYVKLGGIEYEKFKLADTGFNAVDENLLKGFRIRSKFPL